MAITISVGFKDIYYDARANSWKRGRINPREDGLHGEMQMSDDTMDKNVCKRLFIEGLGKLLEVVKEFRPTATGGGVVTIPTTVGSGVGDNYTLSFNVTPNPRNNITASEASALSHAYVLAHIMKGWSRLVDEGSENEWQARMDEAKLRLLSGLRYQTAPTL